MRYQMLCLALAGCADVTAPLPAQSSVSPLIVLASVCDQATVWDFYLDGVGLGLYAFPARGAELRVAVAPGVHRVLRAQWRPVIRSVTDSLTVTDTSRVALDCGAA